MSPSLNLEQKVELGSGIAGFAGILGGAGKIIYTELTQARPSPEDILTGAYAVIMGSLIGIGSGLPSFAREKSKKLGVEVNNYKELLQEWLPVVKEWAPLYGLYEIEKSGKTGDRDSSETLKRLRKQFGEDAYGIVLGNYHCIVSITPTFLAGIAVLDKFI